MGLLQGGNQLKVTVVTRYDTTSNTADTAAAFVSGHQHTDQ